MTINKELHPRSDATWLFVSRKSGERGLIGCENSAKSKEKGLRQKQSRTITICSQNKWNYNKRGNS